MELIAGAPALHPPARWRRPLSRNTKLLETLYSAALLWP